MIQFEQTLVTVLLWAVLASSALFLVEQVMSQVWAGTVARVGMGLGLVASAGSMVVRYVYAGYPPLSNLFESLIFLIFGALLIFVVVDLMLKPKYLGMVAAPLVFLLIGFASVLPARLKDAHPLMPALQSYWLKIHVSLMMLSYSAFLLAFATAAAYLVLYYVGARKARLATDGGPALASAPQVAGISLTMPASSGEAPAGREGQLAFLDDLTFRLILAGFPVLGLGIVTGGVWANHAWGTYWSWDPKETWALITWLIYAGYLHARGLRAWRGQKAAWLSAIGFISVIVTYLGVNYLSSSLHTYGKLL
ncbi:MAG TPA: c-type cytochrome biogenesis protein CcsB [Stenomitos sp.]